MRAWGVTLALLAMSVSLAGCSLFSGSSKSRDVSVFTIRPGQCFNPPTSVKAELSKISRVLCSTAHTEESYAVIKYSAAGTSAGTASKSLSNYPGDDVLSTFAQGACAQRFSSYVGVDYLDSKYYFTYLIPSARSWEQQADRNVLCFITTTGAKLKSSVKGSKE